MATDRHRPGISSWIAAVCVLVFCDCALVREVSADSCTPAADQVALYTERDFRGSCVVKGIGEHPVLTLQGQDVRTRRLPSFASIRLGGRLEVLACSEPKLTGTCIVVSNSLKSLQSLKTDSVRSVVVRLADRPLRCQPDATKVAVWDYRHFFGDCQVFDPGAYPYSPRQLLAGSLVVGGEAKAKLCAGASFESPCRDFRAGSYATWSYEDGGHVVRGIEVRPASVSLACAPGQFQVSLYEFANFVGRCRRFSEGEYTPRETWGWAGDRLHSIWVGEEVLGCTLCWRDDQGRNSCINGFTTAEGLPEFSRDHPPSLRVWLAHEEPPDEEPQGEQPQAGEERSRTVWLAGHAPFQGPLWWDGRFPSVGDSEGTLTRVANPRNSVWLGFLKPGHGSDDCNDANAYVRLERGDTMTANQLREAFGSERPELPIRFVACSGAAADVGAGGELRVPPLPLNISYVEPR